MYIPLLYLQTRAFIRSLEMLFYAVMFCLSVLLQRSETQDPVIYLQSNMIIWSVNVTAAE